MKRIDYFGDRRSRTFACSRCAWTGPGRELAFEEFKELVTLDCPTCDGTIAGFPLLTRDEVEEAAAAGNAEAIAMLRGRSGL